MIKLSKYNQHWKKGFFYGFEKKRKYFKKILSYLDKRQIISITGQIITTDEQGRYHLLIDSLDSSRPVNTIILKLNESSLPASAILISNNPVIVKTSSGLMQKVNFAVEIKE